MKNVIKILIAIFTFIMIYIIVSYLQLKVKYHPVYEWWNEKNAKSDKYNDFFSLTNLLFAFENIIMWRITNIGIPPVFRLDMDIVFFIMYDLMQYKSFVNKDGIPQGCLTPRSLCQTIIPAYGYGDDAFDAWLNTNPQWKSGSTTGNFKGQLYNYSESVALSYIDPPEFYQSGDKIGDSPATPGELKSGSFERAIKSLNDTSVVGIYPSPSDALSWSVLILEWLNGGAVSGKWYIAYGTDNIKHFRLRNDAEENAYGYWYESNTHKDQSKSPDPANFFARMAIEPDSPLLLYFIANQYSVDGIITDPVAFSRLTNSLPGRPGGWLGYVLGKGHNISANELSNYLRTTVQYEQTPPVSCPASESNALSKTSAFVQGFLPMAAMALFNPASTVLVVGSLVAGSALGGLGLANDTKTPDCN